MKAEVNWLDLPYHILFPITDKLPQIIDYVRFGAVCQSWRSFYVENIRENLPLEPLVLILPTNNSKDDKARRSLYNLSQKRPYCNFPAVAVPHNKRCVGSSHGWLATVSDSYEVCLLNTFLSPPCDEIQLPPITAFQETEGGIHDLGYVRKIVLSANPLSDPNFVAVAIHGESGKVSFFKPGDVSWTPLHSYSWLRPISDVIYYKDKFYALHNTGKVVAIDVKHPSSTSLIAFAPKATWGRNYLVESSGELLQVVRVIDYEKVDSRDFYFTTGFNVFKLDLTVHEWIEVNSLGDRMFFLGDNYSLSLSVSDMPGCKPNSIYFTDDNREAYLENRFGPHDFGVFNLEDGSIEPLYPKESKTLSLSPIFIQPTLRSSCN